MKKRKGKRKIISRTRKIVILNIVLVCFFMLGIGYSVLQTTLGIDGLLSLFGWGSPFELEVIETSTPPSGGYNVGDTVYYTVKVKNKSDKVINDVTLVTPTTRETAVPVTETHNVGTLNPGETKEFSCSYIIQICTLFEQTIPLTANVEGENHNGRTVKGTKTTNIIDDEIANRLTERSVTDLAITISPEDDDRTYGLGEKVLFKVTAMNWSAYAKTLSFEPPENMLVNYATFENVAPFEDVETTIEYTIEQDDILRGYKDVPVTLKVHVGSTIVEIYREERFYQIEDKNGHISVTIETTSQQDEYNLGDRIDYKYTVTNDGNLTIKDIKLTTELVGAEWTIAKLAPGESKEYIDDYGVTEADLISGSVINDAQVIGKSPDDDDPDLYAEYYVEDTMANIHLNLNIDISDDEAQDIYHAGDIVHFTILLTNESNLTIYTLQSSVLTFLQGYDSLAPEQTTIKYYTKTITPEMATAGEYCLTVPITGTTYDPDNPTVSTSKSYCVNVS